MGRWSLFLTAIIVISFVFTISCVNKEIPATETYYETESKTESYTDNVSGEDELVLKAHWYCENLVMGTQDTSYSGVWYLGYLLPKHTSSKVVIQTWERNASQNTSGLLSSQQNNDKNEMVTVYDVTTTGYMTEPPFDIPIYTIYHYVYSGGMPDFKSRNVSAFEEQEFNKWLDQFNTSLSESNLGTQFSYGLSSTQGYEFDTTGAIAVAVIIAGREGRIHQDLSQNSGYGFIPQTSFDTPIKSIKSVWSDNITKQREVSYQVEKQRTIMQTKQVPFWEAIR